MRNTGIHHISVLSSSAKEAYDFYHKILGMKLILNTVNQDDNSMIHLFFGDEGGQAGTEFTVFDMGKEFKVNQFGTNAIERTYFLLGSEDSLTYWEDRLESMGVCQYGIEDYNGRKQLRFEDWDGQKLGFTYREDLDLSGLSPFQAPDIPKQHVIYGLAEVHFRVRYPEATAEWLVDRFGFEAAGQFVWQDKAVETYKFPGSVFGHEIHVIVDKTSPVQRLGSGGVHHIAFGVQNKADLQELEDYLADRNKPNSGIVYREFFHSMYFREPNYLLFEVATPLDKDRDTFPAQDKDYEDLDLDLPDFLEGKRQAIEAGLNRS